MTDSNDRGVIRLRDIAAGLLRSLPEAPSALSGLVTLAKVQLGRPLSVGAVLEQRTQSHPDVEALLFEDQHWTYRQFNAWVNRLAHALAKAGVRRGDTVCLLMENHANGLALVAALAKLGAVSGMLNPNLRHDALRHSVKAMAPAGIVVAGECLASWTDLEASAPALRFWVPGHAGTEEPCPEGFTDLEKAAQKSSSQNPSSTGAVQLTDRFAYILTSGTTGLPKASVMSHQRWVRGMAGMGQLTLRLKPGDVLYCALPLYHNNALTVSWGAALGTGAALALDRRFSASRFWDRIRHFEADAFSYIGELCRYLVAQPASGGDRDHHVRACIGNGLRPDIWATFKERFGIKRICEFYGASEGNMVFVNGFNLDQTTGYCPFSFAVVECDLDAAAPKRGPGGRLVKVSKGGTGLLLTEISDSAPFDGYTDARAGESKLVRDAFADGDCWFNTGDLVRDQGWRHIQFVDRLGDTFRWKGENVATTEVEAALRAAPGIADCTVYGVSVPHADGRAGMAAITLAPGATLDGAALASHLAEALPAYAVPLFLRVVAEVETTATFKARKQALREAGFDPSKVPDPVHVLLGKGAGYQVLTSALHADIAAGRLRL